MKKQRNKAGLSRERFRLWLLDPELTEKQRPGVTKLLKELFCKEITNLLKMSVDFKT